METVPHLKFLVIGRTGAGKTTFINSIINQFYNIGYFDERKIAITQHFELVNSEGENIKIKLANNMPEFKQKQSDSDKGQYVSQTEKCNIYTLEKPGLKLSLIDTPGLGDTRGLKQDKTNVASIIEGVKELADFNAICLVQKGNDARVDQMLSYLINELKGMLTKECQNNFIVCFTNVVNKFKIDALGAMKSMAIPTKNFVFFENDCLIPPTLIPDYDSGYGNVAKTFWEANTTNFNKLIEVSLLMTPQKAEKLVDLHCNKTILLQLIEEESQKVSTINDTKRVVQQNQAEIQSYLSQINLNKDFVFNGTTLEYYTVDIDVPDVREEYSSDKLTQCVKAACYNSCHDPCGLDETYSTEGHHKMKNCYAFGGNNNCQFCKHSVDYHKHTNYRKVKCTKKEPVTKCRSVPITNTDWSMKQRFEEADKKKKELETIITQQNQKIGNLEGEIKSSYRKMAFVYQVINNTSLQPMNDSYLSYLDYREKIIKDDVKLTQNEMKLLLNDVENSRKQYQLMMDVVQVAMKNQASALDVNEQNELKAKIEKMKKAEAEVLDFYSKNKK